MRTSPPRRDVLQVLRFALLTRLLVCGLLLAVPRLVPTWDDSAKIALGWKSSYLEGFIRWDVLHFLRIAEQGGYRLEKDYAFLPGAPLILRGSNLAGELVSKWDLLSHSEGRLVGAIVLADLAGILATLVLHQLTYAYTRSQAFSRTAALLYCFPPAPYVLSVPLTEPFFACLVFLGMLFAHSGSFLLATVCFAGTTLFRANGVLNAGFIGWHLLLQPWPRLLPSARLVRSLHVVLLSALIAAPFLAVQRHAFLQFCTPSSTRPWCYNHLPLIYPFVQSQYWDVGLFRYWTLQQAPLFLLSAPVMLLSFAGSIHFYLEHGWSVIHQSLPFLKRSESANVASSPFERLQLLPAIHLHTIMTLVLLLAGHVQICLRQASTNPVIWWYAAHLVTSRSPWGRRWIIYCVGWGLISIVLYATFLPPA